MACPRETTWPTAGSIVNVEPWPYTACEERTADTPACARASAVCAEDTDARSLASFAAAPLVLCSALETVCASPVHRPELTSSGGEPSDPPSLLDGESVEAVSAAPSPAQSTDSFWRAADSVALSPANVAASADSDALAVCNIVSLVVTDCSACCTADGGVPDGTRMLDELA